MLSCDFCFLHVKRHLATVEHQEILNVHSSNQSLTNFADKSNTEVVLTKAEVLFAMLVAEYNFF